MIAIDNLARVSNAQKIFFEKIMEMPTKEVLTVSELKDNLVKHGISLTDDEIK
jgi:hypothetical protein